ncbi:MAG: DUF4252 domain-containing protein [Flavobacteriales bacterium]|nr:DUF4252 domain-containing protein [Flavobacteriales bacterium]
MRYIVYLAIAASLLLVSCNGEPTLQKFFVENSEKKDFIALDLSSNILRLDESSLTSEQKQALNAFDKVNIIAFKSTDKNQKEYQVEKDKLNAILKDKEYQQLIKVGSGSQGASISFVGTEDKIDEFILYANKKENGFAVIRVTGDEMNPTHIMTMLSLLQKSNIDLEQLKPLQGLMQ